MRLLRIRLARWVDRRLVARHAVRPPNLVVGDYQDPYLWRWWVIPRNRWFNVYLHLFWRSDDDRALHDHPWWNLSFLLRGEYAEHTIRPGGIHRRVLRREGDLKFRSPWAAHRVELTDGPCWTLFITGPVLREWGFHCEGGWRSRVDFDGEGCGEANDVRHEASR